MTITLTLTAIVDGLQADAADVNVPFLEIQDILNGVNPIPGVFTSVGVDNGAGEGILTLAGATSGSEGGEIAFRGAATFVTQIQFDMFGNDMRLFRNDATAGTSTLELKNVGAGGVFNLSVQGTLTTGALTMNVTANDDGIHLNGSGVGGPWVYCNATNGTNGNRYTGVLLQNNSTTQWGLELRAGDGSIYIRDRVNAADRLVINTAGQVAIAQALAHQGALLGFFNTTPAARIAQAAYTGTPQAGTFATGTVTLPQLAGTVMNLITGLRAIGLFS